MQTASKTVTSGVETLSQKRVVKLTEKALAYEYDRLQSSRKSKLNKAASIRESIQSLMVKHDKTKVRGALKELIELCGEVKKVQDALLVLLPSDEKEKHEIWFKAKMFNNECVAKTEKWVAENECNENGTAVDDVDPNDSVSNVGKHSSGAVIKVAAQVAHLGQL